MHKRSYTTGHHRSEEIASLLGILLLLISTSWTYAGVRSPVQHWNVWAATTCMLIFLLAPVLAHGTSGTQFKQVMHRISNLVNDPLFWIVSAFLAFLFTQKINTGRIEVFDPINAVWMYTPPPYPGLPWSIDPEDAMDVWRWFYPAGILLLTVRHGLKSSWARRALLSLMTLHAAALGLFGIVVLATNPALTNSWLPPNFFSVFGYPNHAGAFFTLMFGLAVGLGLDSSVTPHRSGRMGTAPLMGIAACLFACCAILAVSRAAMMYIAFIVLCALVYAGVRFFRELSLAKIVNLSLGAIGVLALGYFWVMGTNAKWVTQEAEGLSPETMQSQLLSPTRTYPLRVAAAIWQDHPLYGTGAWGYRHLGPNYMTDAEKELIQEGSANVHMDALQFLSEFGIVGFSLLILAAAFLAAPLRKLNWRQPMPLFASLGLLMVVVASLIDLPFRNPAILCHWIAILSLVGGILSHHTAPAR